MGSAPCASIQLITWYHVVCPYMVQPYMTEHCIVIFRLIELYKDNEKIPYFWRGEKEFQMEEVLDILQLNIDGSRICIGRPMSVTEDTAFVIDTW